MNRRDPLIMVAEPDLVSSGLWPDRHVTQTPLWEVAQNVRFAGGKVERRLPNSPIFDIGNDLPVRGLLQYQDSTGVRWIWANAGPQLRRWYGPASTLVHTFSNFTRDATATQEPTFFDLTNWGDWVIVNSADNGAWLYKPVGGFNALGGGAPTNAVSFFKKRNQLLAIGYGNNRRLVGFSDADSIEEWVSTPTNLAGELPLEEANTPIRAGCHFGPSLAVFSETQMFEVRWIGAPFYYGQQKLLDGIGCVGKRACCADGRLVYGFSVNGAWRTDGQSFSYIDEVIIRDYFQQNINWAQAGKIVVKRNDISGCIEFSFPMGNSLDCNEAWAFDPRYGGWSLVPAFSDMDQRVLFRKPLQGDNAAHIQLIEDFPESAGPLLLETKALLAQRDNNALHLGGLVDEVELFVHNADNVQFQYGVAEFPDGPWTWCDPIEVVSKQITYQPLSRVTGTYHKLRFTSYEDNWAFDLQGFALFGVLDGYKRDKA